MNTNQSPINVTELVAELAIRKNVIDEHYMASSKAMLDALNRYEWQKARSQFDLCLEWNQLRKLALNWTTSLGNQKQPALAVDAWFLRDLIRYLTPGRDEEIAHVTGVRMGNVRVLSRICSIKADKKSPIGVEANAKSCADTEIEILQNGNRLHAMAHSHPGNGIGATRPSSIDINYLGTIQQVGSEAIGIIVTRDGYVGFFTVSKPFRVIVVGNGVKQEEEYVFRVSLPN